MSAICMSLAHTHTHTMSYSGASHSLLVLPAMEEPPEPVLGGERSVGGVITMRHSKFKFQTSTTHVAPHGVGNEQVNIWDSV